MFSNLRSMGEFRSTVGESWRPPFVPGARALGARISFARSKERTWFESARIVPHSAMRTEAPFGRRPATPNARKDRSAVCVIRSVMTRSWIRRRPCAHSRHLFEQSAARIDQAPPDEGREIAFAGRSNAGKSSALNRLSNRRGLARTSRTPGRTQLLNFFLVDGEAQRRAQLPPARFVDLPGYGFAKANHETRDAWQDHVEDYLARRASLVGLVLLMDVRHPFQPFDEHMLAWAEAADMPLLVLLNKADQALAWGCR